MRHTEVVSQPHQLIAPARKKRPLAEVARWTLYAAWASAVLLGLLVWPANVTELGGVHGVAGWLVVASLWTLAAIAARSGVSRSTVWLAVGWGFATTLGALAQHQLGRGGWITLLHVATGVGTIGWGRHLVTAMRRQGDVGATRARPVAGDAVTIEDAAAAFLAKKRIAVTGVSRRPAQHGSNIVYRRLRERGYEVFAINPNAAEVEGDRCFPDLRSIPGGVEAVVIATRPDRAMATMQECRELGIEHVWMHRLMGQGSVSEDAAAWGRGRGMRVIAGGCPLMFGPTSDPGHKVMRSLFTLTGRVPRRV